MLALGWRQTLVFSGGAALHWALQLRQMLKHCVIQGCCSHRQSQQPTVRWTSTSSQAASSPNHAPLLSAPGPAWRRTPARPGARPCVAADVAAVLRAAGAQLETCRASSAQPQVLAFDHTSLTHCFPPSNLLTACHLHCYCLHSVRPVRAPSSLDCSAFVQLSLAP